MTRWPWPLTFKINRFQMLWSTNYVPSLVNIHWRMLILKCSQGCYGRTDGSITISRCNFVGEGIKILKKMKIELTINTDGKRFQYHWFFVGWIFISRVCCSFSYSKINVIIWYSYWQRFLDWYWQSCRYITRNCHQVKVSVCCFICK